MIGSTDIKGVYPATPVPFDDRLQLNAAELSAIHRHMFNTGGIGGITVHGHVGEVLTLNSEERAEVIRVAAAAANPGQVVISGAEGRTVTEVSAQALVAQEAGADALLVFPPVDTHPYRKLARYPQVVASFFEQLSRETDLPLIAFQYAESSGCAYTNETLRELSKLDAVIGVKVNSHTTVRFIEIADAIEDRSTPIVSVDSPEMLGMLMHSSTSLLIGIGSVLPELWSYLLACVRNGHGEQAALLHRRACAPLMDAVFQNHQGRDEVSEASTIKEALRQLGLVSSAGVRFPAQQATRTRCSQIAAALDVAQRTLDEMKVKNA